MADRAGDMKLYADNSSIYVGLRIVKQLEIKIQSSIDAIDKMVSRKRFKMSIINETVTVIVKLK